MDNQWHLSKSVPLTFILAIICQTIALVWYVSSLDSAVELNSRNIVRSEARLDGLEKIVQTQAITLARMDENIKAIRIHLERNVD
jgi:hypothetical protein